MAAEIFGERGKGEYALTKALLMQPIRRGGGGGCGATTGEMETVVVQCSAREATAEARRCSAAAALTHS